MPQKRRTPRTRSPAPAVIELRLRDRRHRDELLLFLLDDLVRTLLEAGLTFDLPHSRWRYSQDERTGEIELLFVDASARKRWRTPPAVREALDAIRPSLSATPRLRPLVDPFSDDRVCACDPRHAPLLLEVSFVALAPYACAACRGVVPPSGTPQTADATELLRTARHIDHLWLRSDIGERWADRQLHDPKSALNRAVRGQARRATKAFGVPVFARQCLRPDRSSAACPVCRRPSSPSILPRTDRACRRCRVAF